MALEKLKIRLLEKTDENDTSSGQSSKILSNREMKIQNFEKLKTEIEKLDLKNANCYDPNESVKLRSILMGKMGKTPGYNSGSEDNVVANIPTDIIRAIQSKIDELEESMVTNQSDGSSGILGTLSKIPTFLSKFLSSDRNIVFFMIGLAVSFALIVIVDDIAQ